MPPWTDSNVDRYEGFVVKAVAPAGAAEVLPGTERRAAIFTGMAPVLAGFLSAIVLATDLGGTVLPWHSPKLLALAIGGLIPWPDLLNHPRQPPEVWLRRMRSSLGSWSRRSTSYEGLEVLERRANARRAGLSELLADWSPEQHRDLSEFLRRVSVNISAEAPMR